MQSAHGGESPSGAGLPLCIAAVTVAGQCRERSPADEAVFGAAGDRFTTRFCDPGTGQALLARAISEGAAEGSAALTTGAGDAPFRVTLWRQRGGDRVRLIAAFAADRPAAPAPAGSQTGSPVAAPSPVAPARAIERAIERDGAREEEAAARGAMGRFAEALRLPLDAVIGLADTLRRSAAAPAAEAQTAAQGDASDAARPVEAEGEVTRLAGDILAAGWRIARVAEDMRRWQGDLPVTGGFDEVDLERLLRRLLRLAGPSAEARGIALQAPTRDGGALVAADEAALWAALQEIVAAALDRLPQGGTLVARLVPDDSDGGLAVCLSALAPEDGGGHGRGHGRGRGRGQSGPAEAPPVLAATEAMLDAHEAELRLQAGNGPGFTATLRFPARRCLSLP
ncbi:MAG: hypothetical protein AAFV49_16520 [Pseudomonadota bacterium]